MSGDLPDEMQSVLSNLDSSLTSLEEHLNPLFDVPWDELSARLDPVEKAKLNLMMAYSAASLFYMYLKSQGISTEDHPVISELARIHAYIKKLKDATGNNEKEKARLRLNTQAAERFIKAGLARKERDEDEVEETTRGDTDPEPKKPSQGKKKPKK